MASFSPWPSPGLRGAELEGGLSREGHGSHRSVSGRVTQSGGRGQMWGGWTGGGGIEAGRPPGPGEKWWALNQAVAAERKEGS